MALGPLPDMQQIVLLKFSGVHNSYLWQQIGYLQYTGIAPAVADLISVGNTVGTAWGTNFGPMCHANVTLNQIDLTDMTSRGSAQASVTALAKVGTRTGTDVLNNTAAVISWKVNRRYKGGHPRTYLPAGVIADITVGRTWTTAFQTALANAAAAYRTALNGITVSGTSYKMVYMNIYTHDPVTKQQLYMTPPVPYTIQSATVHGRVDTQRRRLGRETP